MSQLLDQYIARFANMPGWNIHAVEPNGMKSIPWHEVDGPLMSRELIFDELNPMPQVDTVAADVQKWARFQAIAHRVWTMAERDLRIWKAQFKVKLYESEEKTPPVHIIEAKYRIEKKYKQLSVAVERAEEAYNATTGVYEAFRVKARILERYAPKYHSG